MIHGSSSDEDSVGKMKLCFTYMKIKLKKSERDQLSLTFWSERDKLTPELGFRVGFSS